MQTRIWQFSVCVAVDRRRHNHQTRSSAHKITHSSKSHHHISKGSCSHPSHDRQMIDRDSGIDLPTLILALLILIGIIIAFWPSSML